MKIHLPTPYAPLSLAAPSKPMTEDWMTELEVQVQLTKAAQRRRMQEKRPSGLQQQEEQPSDSDMRESGSRPPPGKFDFLA